MWEWLKTQIYVNDQFSMIQLSEFVLAIVGLVCVVYKPIHFLTARRKEKAVEQTADLHLSIVGDGKILVENWSDTATAKDVRLYLHDKRKGEFLSTECPARIHGYCDPIPDIKPGNEELQWFGFSCDFIPDRITVKWKNGNGTEGECSIAYVY